MKKLLIAYMIFGILPYCGIPVQTMIIEHKNKRLEELEIILKEKILEKSQKIPGYENKSKINKLVIVAVSEID